MSARARSAPVILGFGDAYADPEAPASPMTLAERATRACLDDTGLSKGDIDGILTGREPLGDYRPQWNNIFAAHMKMLPRHSTQITTHGAGVIGMIKHAAMAVNAGVADYVLCVQSDGGLAFADLSAGVMGVDADPVWELPYLPTAAGFYAMMCRRYMYEFGITEADLAATVVAHQAWGSAHPWAERRARGTITVDDVLSSRQVASPLRSLMCAPWRKAGTAGAFIVTTAERAAGAPGAIDILGYGEYSTNEYFTDRMALRGVHPSLGGFPSLTTTGAKEAARQAYAMAGLGPENMDVVQSGSNFAHSSMFYLEDLGFCAKGEAADFIADGSISPGGALPFNTNGGRLSFGQSVMSSPMDTIIELLRQLRGEALGLQVSSPEVGLVQGMGGMLACHTVAILGKGR